MNSVDIDDKDDKATPRFRVDQSRLEPPPSHVFDLPDVGDIQRLTRWLEDDGCSISDFGERLARHGGLSRYVIAVANHTAALAKFTVHTEFGLHTESAVRAESGIRDPTHAAAFLGMRGLQRVLQPLTVESSTNP